MVHSGQGLHVDHLNDVFHEPLDHELTSTDAVLTQGTWVFYADPTRKKQRVSRGYLVDFRGKGANREAVVRFRTRKGVEDFNASLTPLFNNRGAAEEYIHKCDVDEDIVMYASTGQRKALCATLRKKPKAIVMPYFGSAGPRRSYSSLTTAAVLLPLLGKRELSSDILNCYFRLLQRCGERDTKHHFIDTTVAGNVHSGVRISIEIMQTRADNFFDFGGGDQGYMRACLQSKTLETISLVENVSNNHWILGVIQFKVEKYEIWDSHLDPETNYTDLIMRMGCLRKALLPECGEEWEVEHVQCAQQGNLVDCGVFVARFAFAYARGENPRVITARDVQNNFRDRMLFDICVGRISIAR